MQKKLIPIGIDKTSFLVAAPFAVPVPDEI